MQAPRDACPSAPSSSAANSGLGRLVPLIVAAVSPSACVRSAASDGATCARSSAWIDGCSSTHMTTALCRARYPLRPTRDRQPSLANSGSCALARALAVRAEIDLVFGAGTARQYCASTSPRAFGRSAVRSSTAKPVAVVADRAPPRMLTRSRTWLRCEILAVQRAGAMADRSSRSSRFAGKASHATSRRWSAVVSQLTAQCCAASLDPSAASSTIRILSDCRWTLWWPRGGRAFCVTPRALLGSHAEPRSASAYSSRSRNIDTERDDRCKRTFSHFRYRVLGRELISAKP